MPFSSVVEYTLTGDSVQVLLNLIDEMCVSWIFYLICTVPNVSTPKFANQFRMLANKNIWQNQRVTTEFSLDLGSRNRNHPFHFFSSNYTVPGQIFANFPEWMPLCQVLTSRCLDGLFSCFSGIFSLWNRASNLLLRSRNSFEITMAVHVQSLLLKERGQKKIHITDYWNEVYLNLLTMKENENCPDFE